VEGGLRYAERKGGETEQEGRSVALTPRRGGLPCVKREGEANTIAHSTRRGKKGKAFKRGYVISEAQKKEGREASRRLLSPRSRRKSREGRDSVGGSFP